MNSVCLVFLGRAHDDVDALLVEKVLGFLVLLDAPYSGLVHVVGAGFAIGMLGQVGSSVLKRVQGRHVPAHDCIFGTELHPSGRLVASHRTHVVDALVGAQLGYAGLLPHLVEPSSEAVCEEGDLSVASGVCFLHQVDEPVSLGGDEPYVVLVGLRCLLAHRRGVVGGLPAFVSGNDINGELLMMDDIGGLIGAAAGDDGEVYGKRPDVLSGVGGVDLGLDSVFQVFLDLSVVFTAHPVVLLAGLVLDLGFDQGHLGVYEHVRKGDDLFTDAVVDCRVAGTFGLQVLLDQLVVRHVGAGRVDVVHPGREPFPVGVYRALLVAALGPAGYVRVEAVKVCLQVIFPVMPGVGKAHTCDDVMHLLHCVFVIAAFMLGLVKAGQRLLELGAELLIILLQLGDLLVGWLHLGFAVVGRLLIGLFLLSLVLPGVGVLLVCVVLDAFLYHVVLRVCRGSHVGAHLCEHLCPLEVGEAGDLTEVLLHIGEGDVALLERGLAWGIPGAGGLFIRAGGFHIKLLQMISLTWAG